MRITIPDIGVDHASVAEVLVKVGDVVTAEQSLLLLESDKAAVEVPCPQAGRIEAILIKVGAQVQQGDAAFELLEDDAVHNTAQNAEAQQHSTPTAPPQTASTPPQQTVSASVSPPSSVQQAHLNLDDAQAPSSASSSPRLDESTPSLAQAATAHSSTAMVDVQVPDIGVEKAVVMEIMVKVGQEISAEQSIVLLESDKASVEVPSPVAGTVAAILVQTGDSVKEGVVLLQLTTASSAQSASVQTASLVDQNTTASTSAEVAVTTQTQPAAKEVQSTSSSVNEPAILQAQQTQLSQAAPSAAASALSAAQHQDNAQVHAGPAVRQLARQLGVPLREVKATGAHERVVKEDVFAYVKTRLAAPVAASASNAPKQALPALPNFDAFGGGEWRHLTRLQQVSIPQLSLNNYIPQVTQFDMADITELDAWRESLKAEYKNQGISLTILAFIAKAVAYLLKKEPYFAAHLSDDATSVLLRHEIHMGIAVATPEGLTVPVLRHPEQKSIAQIAQELMDLSQKARDKKLSPKDLQGANFSITSLGSIGGTAFTPLVNWPQVAILGISPARIQPEWDGTQFVPRLMLPLSLSYDHRVINGADAARFCHQLTLILQDIRQILL